MIGGGEISPPPPPTEVPASSITVNDYASQRVFQRVASARTITVAGNVGGTPSGVQARAVPYGTSISSSAYAWTTIAINPVTTYSGTLNVPQGGWYEIQVRDTAASVSAKGTNKWGVGIIVASIGQSNEQDPYSLSLNYPSGDSRAIAYISGDWNRIGNQADTFPPGTAYPTYGAAYTTGLASIDGDSLVYLANRLAAANSCPVCILPYAVGGSTISTWIPGSGANWTAFAAAAAAAGGDFEACIWLQGESDAGGDMAVYKTNLAAVRAGLLSITSRASSALAMAVVPIGPCTTSWTAVEGRFGAVRQAHLEYVAGASGVSILNSATDASLRDGQVHYTQASHDRKARRTAEWVTRAAAGTPSTLQGPKISGASISVNTITITISHQGGTTLLDGAGGSGTSLAGFRVFDGGTPITISGTSITGASTITLTLSTVPLGVVTMDYAMLNLTFGSQTPAASVIVYDNQSIPGDTLGIPLQPKPTFTVS